MSVTDSSTFFKTFSLVTAGAMFGYALAKGRCVSGANQPKRDFNFNEVNKVHDSKQLLKFLKEKLKNYPPILDRKFTRLVESSGQDANEFRVMQYNILARGLCFPDKNGKAPVDTYDWEKYRLWRTLEELVRHDCDIMCIEEADVYEELKPYLNALGYTSIFAPKFSSPCLEQQSNVGPDGLAVFYRLSKFQVINMSCEKIVLNSDINSQVFVIIQLRHKPSGNLVTLVCLHLKSKVENHERRDSQIGEILKALKAHLFSSFGSVNKHPVIMCGDFNGEPFEKFYKKIVKNGDLDFRDAYTFEPNPKQPTTIKKRGEEGKMLRRGIDYIFYTQDKLELTEYLELPENDLLINEQGLPNLSHASDHLSLVASFKFAN